MIASLTGVLEAIGEDFAVVDVGGVGYHAFCSSRSLGQMPAVGSPVRLEIETHVREDHIHLFGFIDAAERDWFRMLTTVQGVGAKVALAILSALGAEELTQAVASQDKTAVVRANGVGPKLAGRIVSELKDKVGSILVAESFANADPAAGGPQEEAVSALVNLGFQRMDAFGAVARAGQELGDKAGLDELIRAGLKELSQ
jgi:Holliday junction DNA helicase RuvA